MGDHPPDGIDPAERYVALTTYRSTGAMVTTPVWFVDGPHELRVITDATAGKVRRLREDDRVLVSACDARGRVTGPTVAGRAVVDDDPAALAGLVRAVEAKYGIQAQALLRLRSALGREPARVQLRVTLDG